ncbi:MAG: hypothetical protein M0004_15660 [Actinomycetota bacterium]|nr:hypothetical protein [Actinomycetota bacterium]
MRRAGEESWHLSVDDNLGLPHLALYVRDACRLAIPDDSSVPPPLDGDVVDHSDVLDPAVRGVAGAQWLSWWKDILSLNTAEALRTLRFPDSQLTPLDALVVVDEHLLDWPELDVLESRPELRRAVIACHDDAVRWGSDRSRRLGTRDPRTRGLAHLPVSAIAEGVIQRFGVSPGRVRAAVVVLGVQGEWSALPFAGLLLCSASLAIDAQKLTPLLEGAFASGTAAEGVVIPGRTRKTRALPPSVIHEPMMLWERDGASLTCERVIPYHDGFEIELRRNGLGPLSSSDATAPRKRPNRRFVGIQIRLSFADGREELLDDVERPDREGPITLSAFGRRESGDDTLWLWVMPLPPPGEVRMTIEWPTYGMDPVSVSFGGADIRRRRTA